MTEELRLPLYALSAPNNLRPHASSLLRDNAPHVRTVRARWTAASGIEAPRLLPETALIVASTTDPGHVVPS
jgi:hypothetical protein